MEKKFDNTNRGVLFANKFSDGDNPNRPNLSGTLELGVDGLHDLSEKYKNKEPLVIDVSAWKKAAKNSGQNYLSLSVRKHQDKQSFQKKEAPQESSFDDDIPF